MDLYPAEIANKILTQREALHKNEILRRSIVLKIQAFKRNLIIQHGRLCIFRLVHHPMEICRYRFSITIFD